MDHVHELHLSTPSAPIPTRATMLAAILLILGNIFIFALSYWYIHRETKVSDRLYGL
jgi:hypothetical protein